MKNLNKKYAKKDLKYIWHPCSQMKYYCKDSSNLDSKNLPLVPIKRAKGVYLYDFNGKKYIDCISSWWVNLFGHRNAYINKKIKKQLRDLEHIIMAGFTHKSIIDLSARLCGLLPSDLSKCFYADNGSSAIEVALKMSFHYFKNMESKRDIFDKSRLDSQNIIESKLQDSKNLTESNSQQSLDSNNTADSNSQKTLFLCLENSYHGETLGALSVGDVPLYKETYKPLLLQALTTPVPNFMNENISSDFHNKSPQDSINNHKNKKTTTYCLQELEKILNTHGSKISAFILEPLVQCAGNMNMYPANFVKKACEMCRARGILVIFDEIAVGFGRSGRMFALEICDFVPDFLCLSKGISGGYLPLSIVVTSERIYRAFYDDEVKRAFLHSHSYTGNALACAAANATLDIFEKRNILAKNARKSAYIWEHLNTILAQDSIKHKVKNARKCGMIFAFDIDFAESRLCDSKDIMESKLQDSINLQNIESKDLKNADSKDSKDSTDTDSTNSKNQKNYGYIFYKKALKKGLLLRPLGNTIYLMPPYTITKKQINYILKNIEKILKKL